MESELRPRFGAPAEAREGALIFKYKLYIILSSFVTFTVTVTITITTSTSTSTKFKFSYQLPVGNFFIFYLILINDYLVIFTTFFLHHDLTLAL